MTTMDEAIIAAPPQLGAEEELSWQGEAVELELKDGRKIVGRLAAFDGHRQSVEVALRVKDKGANVSFRLEEFKKLHLLATRELAADTPAGQADTAGLEHHSARLNFNIQYTDGDNFSGTTFGFRVNRYGLCLYPVRGERNYTCLLIPHGAIASYEVGPRIGEVLINENLVSQDQLDRFLARQREERDRPLGDYLSSKMLVTVEELSRALDLQKTFPNLRLGEILLGEKLISQEQLSAALEEQKKNREKPLGEILIEAGVVSKRDIQFGLAKKLGIPFVDLRKFPIDAALVKSLPEDVARRHQVLPLFTRGKRLAVAMVNPLDYKVLETLQFHTGRVIEPVFAQEDDLDRAIGLAYTGMGLSEILSDDYLWEEQEEQPEHRADADMDGVGGVIIKLVNKLIMDAYQQGVSDIHIEPRAGREKTRVRFRRDGMLRDYYEVPAELRQALIARIKVMAELDISVRRKPQDGKISFGKFSPLKIDLRVATLPTAGGEEDVVMRILGVNKPIPVDRLGLSARDRAVVERVIHQPYGLFLVCGPTGSGKTTSLHSILSTINTPERKIWTAEDPVEITQPGLRQVQVNNKVGLTFAAAMRSFLRADPDVIMVGEMRDRETAQIAIEASLTGHLVVTTLHTNSAAESVVRLVDMGMDPFNFADALVAIMAQRLVRTLCGHCKASYTADDGELQVLAHEYARDLLHDGTPGDGIEAEVLARWRADHGDAITLCRAVGCEECDGSGYRGRMGLYELLEGTRAVKKLIIDGAPVTQLQAAALADGMRTLKQDGIDKILRGHTDLAQVRKVAAG